MSTRFSLEKAKELLAGDACPELSSSIRTTRKTRTCHQLSGSLRSAQAQSPKVERSSSLLLRKRQLRLRQTPTAGPAFAGTTGEWEKLDSYSGFPINLPSSPITPRRKVRTQI